MSHYIKSNRTTVLLGDYNCVCNAGDRFPITRNNDASANRLSEIIAENNMEDVFHISRGTKKIQFTHFQESSHARLDRVYVSADIVHNISSYCVKPVFFSDHCLVKVAIGENKIPKAKFNWRLWKLNTSLLKDKTFVATVDDLLRKITEQNETCPLERWERFKEQVKMSAIERSSTLKFYARAEERKLQKDLRTLCEAECECPGWGTKDIANVKTRLEKFQKERYEGAVIRSRT